MNRYRVQRIISGGQTGVDRGALDAAIAMGVPHGGWCPRGRRAEDGSIPLRYRLAETESPEYRARTEQNVRDSTATLILAHGRLSGGSELTRQLAETHAKPCLVVDLDRKLNLAPVRRWLARNRVRVLNVAGPRESQSPGIAAEATECVKKLLAREE